MTSPFILHSGLQNCHNFNNVYCFTTFWIPGLNYMKLFTKFDISSANHIVVCFRLIHYFLFHVLWHCFIPYYTSGLDMDQLCLIFTGKLLSFVLCNQWTLKSTIIRGVTGIIGHQKFLRRFFTLSKGNYSKKCCIFSDRHGIYAFSIEVYMYIVFLKRHVH